MQQVGQLSIQVSRVPRNRNYLSVDDSAILSKPGQWSFSIPYPLTCFSIRTSFQTALLMVFRRQDSSSHLSALQQLLSTQCSKLSKPLAPLFKALSSSLLLHFLVNIS